MRQTRTLNTVQIDSAAIASLASNQISLPAGTYRVKDTVTMKAPAGHVLLGRCPHCKAALDAHDTEDKDAPTFGALHCPDCRCCFKANGKLRERAATCSVDASTDEAHEFTHTGD